MAVSTIIRAAGRGITRPRGLGLIPWPVSTECELQNSSAHDLGDGSFIVMTIPIARCARVGAGFCLDMARIWADGFY